MSEEKAIPVTQLVRRMRNALELSVGELWVEGEVSNLRRQASGHAYFSLKDSGAQISCAMFGAKRKPGGPLLADGAKVRAFVEVTLYEPRGQAQLVVREVRVAGQGDLQARFEALKRKLNEEGLFAPERKQALPFFPRRVGLVTSPTGAALQDMLNVLGRRAPWLEVVIFPAQVQGAGAEVGIARGITELGSAATYGHPEVDVIVVGRGGGSIEDLWNFNEEVVARAISACPVPVVSAVGHEIDFTISDFVADLRAPTPSAAAELIVPDRGELQQRIQATHQRMSAQLARRLELYQARLSGLRTLVAPERSARDLRERAQRLDDARDGLEEATLAYLDQLARRLSEQEKRRELERPERIVERARAQLATVGALLAERVQRQLIRRQEAVTRQADLLRAIGPEATLARGFSMTLDESGKLVSTVEDVRKGEVLVTRLADGEVKGKVLSVERQ